MICHGLPPKMNKLAGLLSRRTKKERRCGVSLYSGAEREVAFAGCLLLFVDVGQGLSFVLAGEGFEETLDFGDVVF